MESCEVWAWSQDQWSLLPYLLFWTRVWKARDLPECQKNSCFHSGESRASIIDHSERQLPWNQIFLQSALSISSEISTQSKMLSQHLTFMGDSDCLRNLMKVKDHLRKTGIHKKQHTSLGFSRNCLKPTLIILILILIANTEYWPCARLWVHHVNKADTILGYMELPF